MNKPRQVIVKKDDLKRIKCSSTFCDSTFFTNIFELGFLSKIVSPNGQDQVIQLPKMVCIKCGSPPDLKNPIDMKEDKNKEDKDKESNIKLN